LLDLTTALTRLAGEVEKFDDVRRQHISPQSRQGVVEVEQFRLPPAAIPDHQRGRAADHRCVCRVPGPRVIDEVRAQIARPPLQELALASNERRSRSQPGSWTSAVASRLVIGPFGRHSCRGEFAAARRRRAAAGSAATCGRPLWPASRRRVISDMLPFYVSGHDHQLEMPTSYGRRTPTKTAACSLSGGSTPGASGRITPGAGDGLGSVAMRMRTPAATRLASKYQSRFMRGF